MLQVIAEDVGTKLKEKKATHKLYSGLAQPDSLAHYQGF